MPLRDHFRPPLSEIALSEEVHGQWPAVIVQQLGKILPECYVAAPRVRLGSQIEIDIAALDRGGPLAAPAGVSVSHDGGVATALWAPAAPSLAVETELADFDEYEVRVYDASRGRRLVAAAEIVSPANKDRPEIRRQFVAKCVALLRQSVSVVIVDLVTPRDFNLYAELLHWVGQRDPSLGDDLSATYAVACRWHPRGATRWLETWNYPMSDDLAIPLDLEVSYEQTCRDLRIG